MSCVYDKRLYYIKNIVHCIYYYMYIYTIIILRLDFNKAPIRIFYRIY